MSSFLDSQNNKAALELVTGFLQQKKRDRDWTWFTHRIVRALEDAEGRGQTRGFAQGYESARNEQAGQIERSLGPLGEDEIDHTVQEAADAFYLAANPGPKEPSDPDVLNAAAKLDEFPFPTDDDHFFSDDVDHGCTVYWPADVEPPAEAK